MPSVRISQKRAREWKLANWSAWLKATDSTHRSCQRCWDRSSTRSRSEPRTISCLTDSFLLWFLRSMPLRCRTLRARSPSPQSVRGLLSVRRGSSISLSWSFRARLTKAKPKRRRPLLVSFVVPQPRTQTHIPYILVPLWLSLPTTMSLIFSRLRNRPANRAFL